MLPLLAAAAWTIPGNAQTDDELVNSLGMRFVLVPRARFEMGSPASEPYRRKDETQHEVELTRSYWLGMHEVSQREFQEVMGRNPSFFAPSGIGRSRVRPKEASIHPVEGVSWHDAVEFCRRLSEMTDEKRRRHRYRLPTEAEWEWACRAGTVTPIYFGPEPTSREANYNGTAPFGTSRLGPFLKATTPVGGYRANVFRLHDLHGNVAEWCGDWYSATYYDESPKTDPTGPSEGTERVVRGGGWANTARECRSAARNHFPPDFVSYNIGFRVVLLKDE